MLITRKIDQSIIYSSFSIDESEDIINERQEITAKHDDLN